MPRNVRNFWVEGHIDGRASSFSGGPQRRDGGFSMTVYQRDKGSIVTALRVSGRTLSDGSIVLDVEAPLSELPLPDGGFRVKTQR